LDTKNGKRKGNNSSPERITKKKKKRPVKHKHCILCKKHGGATASRNTYACKKYDKNGNLKSTWKYKSGKKARKSNSKSYAQFDDRISRLEKNIKKYLKAKASHSNQKKRHYKSNSDSDSDSN
jgi:hypothetical protein